MKKGELLFINGGFVFRMISVAAFAALLLALSQAADAPLSPSEIPARPKSSPPQRLSRGDLLRAFDSNGDGKLDAKERAAARTAMEAGKVPQTASSAPASLSVERKQAIDKVNQEHVRKHDKNGDGVLDQDERDALWTEYMEQVRLKKARQTGGK